MITGAFVYLHHSFQYFHICAGGMMSFLVRGDATAARAVCNRVKVITQATSLGATESLIEHRQSVEDRPLSPPNLLRLV